MKPSLFIAIIASCLLSSYASADLISSSDIQPIPASTIGSGNGTLDLRMFTFSGSEIDNASGSFNGDNGNNSLPNSGSGNAFGESYLTTAGELQQFYVLNFPNGSGGSTVNELVLFLDLNETGGGQLVNSLDILDINVNPTSVGGSPNPHGDVTSSEQAAINHVHTGGTIMANINTSHNLPVLAQGAGFADYAIFTGIDPFSLNANDVVLINLSMSFLNNGAEEIFLSGEFAGRDVIPEPSSSVLLLGIAASIGLCRRRRQV